LSPALRAPGRPQIAWFLLPRSGPLRALRSFPTRRSSDLAPGSWSVRPRGTGAAPMQLGAGEMTWDVEIPEPEPAPVTTIAWRLGHVIVGVLGMRNASHFGRDPVTERTHTYAATAAEALAQLEAEYATWV